MVFDYILMNKVNKIIVATDINNDQPIVKFSFG